MFSDDLLLVYKNATDTFYIKFLSFDLLNSHISSSTSFVHS